MDVCHLWCVTSRLPQPSAEHAYPLLGCGSLMQMCDDCTCTLGFPCLAMGMLACCLAVEKLNVGWRLQRSSAHVQPLCMCNMGVVVMYSPVH